MWILFGLLFFCLIVKQAQASVCDQKKKKKTALVQYKRYVQKPKLMSHQLYTPTLAHM